MDRFGIIVIQCNVHVFVQTELKFILMTFDVRPSTISVTIGKPVRPGIVFKLAIIIFELPLSEFFDF